MKKIRNINKEKIWFKRKDYGYGWTPCSKEGWIVMLLFVLLTFLTAGIFKSAAKSDGEFLILFLPSEILFSILLIFVCYKKGEKPKWQFGKKKR